jgi:hypothetical protein
LATFLPRKKQFIGFDKNGLGFILDGLFTHSSGHPAFGSVVTDRVCFPVYYHLTIYKAKSSLERFENKKIFSSTFVKVL